MSELRVALVAEGPTDRIVIEAALEALLPSPFVLTQLQPEATRPMMGAGWGGVVRWGIEFASRGCLGLEGDPTLPGFDLFIVHVDADVAEFGYDDVAPGMAELADKRGWPPLPCKHPCPPSSASADEIRRRLLAWMGLAAPGPKTVLCVPSKATEAWLVASLLDDGHMLLDKLECNLGLETQLKALPKDQRVKKTGREYLARKAKITSEWSKVRRRCPQADRFSCEVSAALP